MAERPSSMSRRRFFKSATVAVSTTVILAACGGGAPTTTTTSTEGASASAGSTSAPAAAPTGAAATGPTSAAGSSTKTTFASQIDTAGIKKGGTIIIGSTADVRTLNPVLVSDTASAEITNLVFDGLINIDPDTLEPVPNLATKWDISSDNKTYTFTIKEGVKWHDGQPFSAEDVKFSYDLYMNPDTGTPRAGELNERIASVEAKDATTLVITLKNVTAPFLVSNTGYGIVPKHILSSVAPKDIPTNEFSTSKPIGTGPFKFQEFKQGDHVSLTANPDYHGGAPALAGYLRKYVKDDTALYQQLKTGEVDVAGFGPNFYADAQQQSNFTTYSYDTFNFLFTGYNLDTKTGSPIFQDVKVRQALFYAIDRKGIVEKIQNGLSTVAYGTMPVLSWAYQPDKITSRYDYDPDKANQLLDEAGWAKGSDGIRAKDGQKLSFSMYTYSGDKTIEGYMTVFQQNWKDIGVEMNPQFEEFSAFVTRLTKTFDFQMFLVGFSWGVDPDQQTMWDSKQHGAGFNLYDYKNPKVDDLLAQGLTTLDQEKRKQIYLDMQNLVLADAPALITDFPKALAGVNKRVKNYIPNAVSTTINAYQWYVTDGK